MRQLWAQAEIEILKRDYPNMPTGNLAALLRRPLSKVYAAAARHGLRKSAEYLASPHACRLLRGDKVGWSHRFEKGHVPFNKGLRRPGWSPGRMRQTQFKKGERRGMSAKNWCPVGTVKADPQGYLRIKVRDAEYPKEASGFGNVKVWPLLNRHNWEKANGPIPKGHILIFRDHNRNNCDVSNLELISRQELMSRNTVHNLPKELAQIIQLNGALKRKIRNLNGRNENKISDLRNHLFEALEALKDHEKPMDLERAKAICGVSQQIIDTAKVEVSFMEVTGELPTNDFFDIDERATLADKLHSKPNGRLKAGREPS